MGASPGASQTASITPDSVLDRVRRYTPRGSDCDTCAGTSVTVTSTESEVVMLPSETASVMAMVVLESTCGAANEAAREDGSEKVMFMAESCDHR